LWQQVFQAVICVLLAVLCATQSHLSAPGQGLLCPSAFLTKITYAFLNSTIYATCSVSLTQLHLCCFLSLRSKYSSRNCALKHIHVLRFWRKAELHTHITNVKLRFSHFNVTIVFSCIIVVATMDKIQRETYLIGMPFVIVEC